MNINMNVHNDRRLEDVIGMITENHIAINPRTADASAFADAVKEKYRWAREFGDKDRYDGIVNYVTNFIQEKCGVNIRTDSFPKIKDAWRQYAAPRYIG